MATRLTVFADYHQVHIIDPGEKSDPSDAWTAQAVEDRIAVARGFVGIGTRDADDVKVEVSILKRAPTKEATGNHVTLSSLRLKSNTAAVLGCTDSLPDALHLKLKAGDWRVRVSHRDLEKKTEKLVIELWPETYADPLVVKRFAPSKKKATPKKPKVKKVTAQSLASQARSGDWQNALEGLLTFAKAGDVAAAASVAEILAALGKWDEMVPHVTALIAKPDAVYAGNVFVDCSRLLRRAARELKDDSIIKKAAALAPSRVAGMRDAVLLKDLRENRPDDSPAALKAFHDAVKTAEAGPRFKGKPEVLAQHCLALAVVFRIDSEILKRFDPRLAMFDQALEVARVHVRAGRPDDAWQVIESMLPKWGPVDSAQVFPVTLLVDSLLAPLMSVKRATQVLATPRGEHRPENHG